jgi:propionyl-CoA carboxylase alpha chain/3-methylcrotonyl-CoA carboxylase alpha subunit/acetyl-CoA/propionyl-CoA carboxylase biotin carboxyl carrier protein
MSIARDHLELQNALRQAASEAAKYFGDKRVYVERYFRSARHIEVQVLGDGVDVIHMGERECSIQRRFQKLIEEAPSPALTSEKRHAICETAVEIARAARYRSAGTVEFLYTPDGEFFFLEMNTRIQVEHPVTELVYGVDLVAEQIRVAAGYPLGLRQQDVRMKGHAIECRVCAENAFKGFLPETGKVLFLKEPAGAGIRFDSGLYLGQDITTSFDPMLAKLIVHAPTRTEAIAGLIRALKDLVLLGVTTNIEHLIKVLEHPAFVAGNFDTGFLTNHADELTATASAVEQLQAALIAGLLTDRDTRSYMDATPEPYAAIGHWRN